MLAARNNGAGSGPTRLTWEKRVTDQRIGWTRMMCAMAAIVASAAWLGGCVQSTTQPADDVVAMPECDLIARHAGGAVTIDGKLDEAAWSNTPATPDFGGPYIVDNQPPDELHARPEYRTFS